MHPETPWWRGATIYHIYVRSWLDSDGDGVGDLGGVSQRLDYLSWLGIDCIWLSPTMPSPNTDWGYDVADYCEVDAALGTLEDMDSLVKQSAERGISILLDLVPNHTSSAHPWFVDARSGRDAEHRGYYVWSDPKPGGALPNNWLDATGKPAWTWDGASSQYYLHNFLATQPDLNWWDERVHEEFDGILRFWFERGIAGFRVDVAHGLYKDSLLRNNPQGHPDDHPASLRDGQRMVYNNRRPEVHAIYRRWRELADSYDPPRVFLGETWEFDFARLGDFYGRARPELQLNFNFPFVLSGLSSHQLCGIVEGALSALPPGATPVWTASNHDVGRFPTRWCRNDPGATRAALVLLATLPGTLVLYYGDELGMLDVDVPVSRQVDEMSLARPGSPSRDRCRTPMQWSNEKNGGFCPPRARPWLPLGDKNSTNVRDEKADPGSVLSLCRELLALRKSGRIADAGPVERVFLDDSAWAFRAGGVTTVANLSPRPEVRQLGGALTVLASTRPERKGEATGPVLQLGPWEALVLG